MPMSDLLVCEGRRLAEFLTVGALALLLLLGVLLGAMVLLLPLRQLA